MIHPRDRFSLPWDGLLGFVLCAGYVALLVATESDLGPSRDESFYAIAAERYGTWFELLWREPAEALSREAIDRAWSYNHEHPGLVKGLFALSHLAMRHGVIFEQGILAVRFPAMLSAGLLLWLLYAWGRRLFGRLAGLSAALLMAAMPRFFYHAHLACFDVPIVTAITFVTYAYWRSLASIRWVPVVGIAYGLALGTKHNAWIVPGVLLVHWVWWRLAAWRRGEEASWRQRMPWWLLSMATLGPLLFVGSWPWLWYDGWERFLWYARFHLQHVHYSIAYLGTTWWRPPFPWHYPFVMTALTVPATTLTAGSFALLSRARSWWPFPWPRSLPGPRPDALRTDVLLLGSLLAPMVAIAWPSSPIFGGTKHWLTAYPFLALYAGEGVRRALEAAGRTRRFTVLGVTRSLALGGLWGLLMAPAWVESAHAHPFGLSHYGPLAGGPPGAADLGMNRQFWGFTTGSVAPWVERALPRGGSLFLCDTTDKAWWMLQADGRAPMRVRSQWTMGRADLALIHHEDHFAEVEGQAWVAFGQVAPLHVLTYDGVPIVTVYGSERVRERIERDERGRISRP